MRLRELDGLIEGMEYPTTTEEIIDAHGGQELALQEGAETLEGVLSTCGSERFGCAEEARLSLYGSLPEDAIGRKGYADRDPPVVSGEIEHVSF